MRLSKNFTIFIQDGQLIVKHIFSGNLKIKQLLECYITDIFCHPYIWEFWFGIATYNTIPINIRSFWIKTFIIFVNPSTRHSNFKLVVVCVERESERERVVDHRLCSITLPPPTKWKTRNISSTGWWKLKISTPTFILYFIRGIFNKCYWKINGGRLFRHQKIRVTKNKRECNWVGGCVLLKLSKKKKIRNNDSDLKLVHHPVFYMIEYKYCVCIYIYI